jgi:hypothetical protein
MGREVNYTQEVDLFFAELAHTLFARGYFGYMDTARAYAERLYVYTQQYVGILLGKDAPPEFVRYGKELKYIAYRANKATTWYILYRQQGNRFLVCHITNNHVAGQYFV